MEYVQAGVVIYYGLRIGVCWALFGFPCRENRVSGQTTCRGRRSDDRRGSHDGKMECQAMSHGEKPELKAGSKLHVDVGELMGGG